MVGRSLAPVPLVRETVATIMVPPADVAILGRRLVDY
jgi:hypothetical protein